MARHMSSANYVDQLQRVTAMLNSYIELFNLLCSAVTIPASASASSYISEAVNRGLGAGCGLGT